MHNIVNQKSTTREVWRQQLANVITDPIELLTILKLDHNERLLAGHSARRLFPLRVPRTFVNRMQSGNPADPLLLQVLTQQNEFIARPGFSIDPLEEHFSILPGVLHKYYNRVLLILKTGCAINCRYCFRRHFPYQDHHFNASTTEALLHYLQQHSEVDEVILSGGDPLMANDKEIENLCTKIAELKQVKRLRIHTRLPIVIPARVTSALCNIFQQTPMRIVLVTHINHSQEIDDTVISAMDALKKADVTLLNQSVLLKNINDNTNSLIALSNALYDQAGILPYYLHLLDKVDGASHFWIDDHTAKALIKGVMEKISGYLVPRLVREIAGEKSKIPLDLSLSR